MFPNLPAKTPGDLAADPFGDRLVFPAAGFRKSDVLEYYTRAADFLLPHLRDRPVTLQRYPDQAGGPFFYEKDAPAYTPAWVKKFGVWRRSGESQICYIAIRDLATLRWVVEVGTLEIHSFLARAPRIEVPTHLVFDLDPGEPAGILHCARVALLLRDFLRRLRLECFAKVSGSKGIQVYVPLNTSADYAITQPFARSLAELLQRRHPELVIARMEKRERRGKVFVDWSQNADYKTTVSVYSLRAKRRHPYVSMPVSWDELRSALASGDASPLLFSPAAALDRLEKLGDLFQPVITLKQQLPSSFTQALAPLGERARRPHPAKVVSMPRRSAQGSRRVFILEPQKGRLWRLRMQVGETSTAWLLPQGVPEVPGESLPAIEAAGPTALPTASPKPKGRETGTCELIEGSLRAGAMRLFFDTGRLRGEWLLVRQPDRTWQLRRSAGAEYEPGLAEVLHMPAPPAAATAPAAEPPPSNRRMRRPRARVPRELRSLPQAEPRFVPPMECRLVNSVPEGPDWLYELKLDGYRALAVVYRRQVRLLSRHDNDLGAQFPSLREALQSSRLPDCVLDGEIVALDQHGKPSFQQLQNRRGAQADIVFYVFDALNYAGRDLTGIPLSARRRLLEGLAPRFAQPVRLSAVLDATPEHIVREINSRGLEGIVAKRLDSFYNPGKRPGSWLKYRTNEKEDFIIGGYLPGTHYLEAILVGRWQGKRLMFVKKLRNGFVPRTREEVFRAIAPLRIATCPFANLPEKEPRRGAVDAQEMKRCVWVKPEIQCEVEFTEWTAGGRLRHAAFRQLVT